MKRIIRKFITCCLLFTTTVINAQQMLPSDVPTPNASSLGRYGDVPVSYYTGRPNVSILIYTLKVRDFSLPISLAYDAGGVLVNSLPSWVGQNWILNAGGVITRTVQGRYDEWIYPKQKQLSNVKNYYHSIGELPNLLKQSSNNYAALKKDATYGYHDLAPDIFTFNFCGKTGKFFLGNDGNWKVLSDENLEILFDYTNDNNFITPFIATYPYKQAVDKNQRKTIKGFTIRDSEGTTYEFGMNLNAIDFTTNIWHMSLNEQNESWHAMSWYLTKVSDRHGNVLISLDYDRGAYIIQAYNSYEYNHVKEEGSWYGHYGQEYAGANSYFPYGMTISSPVYLTSIKGDNGVIIRFSSSNDSTLLTENIYNDLYSKNGGINGLYNCLASMVYNFGMTNGSYREGAFYYLQSDDAGLSQYRYTPQNDNKKDILSHARLRKLNKIAISSAVRISDLTYTLGYRFMYGYTNNRMFLDSLQIQDDAINYSQKMGSVGFYRFNYIDKEKLPASYLTTAIDHWGYYNGKAYSIPSDKNFDSFKNTRNSNSTYTQYGSLSEIQYPTGGVSSFEYELNTYSAYQSDDRQSLIKENGNAGGLRIKSITEYDSPDHKTMLKKRTFEYTIPGTNLSSGELFATPKYYWPKWSAWCVGNNAKHEVETFRTSSIIPLSNSFGPSIGYSYVTENVKDLKNPQQNMMKTIYRFSNLSDADMKDERFYLSFSNNQPSPEDMFSERGFKRGKLISQQTFDGSNNKTESITYKYRSDSNMNSQYTYTSNLKYGNNGCSASFGYYGGGIYKLYYPQYDVIEKTDSTFSQKSKITTTVQYSKIDTTFQTSQPYAHSTSIRLLKSEKDIQGGDYILKKYDYGNFSDNSMTALLHRDQFYLVPKEEQTSHNGNLVNKRTTIYTKVYNKFIVPAMTIETYPSGVKDTLVRYRNYTNTGRLQIYKELGKPQIFLKWGYHDNYLLMKGTSNIPISFTDNEVFDEKVCLNKESSYIRSNGNIMGYVYHPFLGIIDIISPNGYIKKYRYDKVGRLIGIYDNVDKVIEKFSYNYRK